MRFGSLRRAVSIVCACLCLLWTVAGCVSQKPASALQDPETATSIHDLMPKLITGSPVDADELFDCLTYFERTTWTELEQTYGGPEQSGRPWFDALWCALRDGAVVDEPQTQSDRIYGIGKAFLSSDGAYSEGLIELVLSQWRANYAFYSETLNTRFSEEEAWSLRRMITAWIPNSTQSGFQSGLGMSVLADSKAILMQPYPTDFAFGCSLVETERKEYRAESFGPCIAVEGNGFHITYLNPAEGVYMPILIRANKPGFALMGASIGDSESAIEQIGVQTFYGLSYDDDAWFGKDYERVYLFTPESGTISAVFLAKDAKIVGLELINGLDGLAYGTAH